MSSYSDYASAASDILLKKGEAQARAKELSGSEWGSTIANLGQVIPQQVQQAIAQNAQKKKLAQIQGIIQQNGGDLEKSIPLINGIDPELGAHFTKEIGEAQKTQYELAKLKHEYETQQNNVLMNKLGSAANQSQWSSALYGMHQAGLDVSGYPQDWSPEAQQQVNMSLTTAKDRLDRSVPKEPKYEKVETVDESGKPITKFVNPAAQESYPVAPKPESFQKVETTDAMGKPVTQFVQPSAGAQYPVPPKDTTMTPYQEQELALRRRSEGRLEAQAAQANAPAIEIKPGSAEYQVAKDLASGKLTMIDFQRLYGRAEKNAGLRQGIYNVARQLNPDFEPAQFELGFKMAGNPQIRQRVVAINAIDPVMTRMEELIDKSGNTNIPALNSLLNSAKFQIGNQTVTNFRQLQTLLGDEIGNALGVGTGSDLKTRLGIDLVNPNLSPGNFRANMEQARTALQQRRGELYKTMGPYSGAAGAPPPAATVPANVSSLLQSQKPGEYTLSDGHTYRRAADGSISVIK